MPRRVFVRPAVLSLLALFLAGCSPQLRPDPVPAVAASQLPQETPQAPADTAPAAAEPTPAPLPAADAAAPVVDPRTLSVPVWGIVGLRGFAFSEQVAPNGLEYRPLFSLDLDFNFWLYRPAGVYVFSDSRFWGQQPAPGQTNPAQGPFDFSKREFDFNAGLAWNYQGALEARAFAYSFNNLNRGVWMDRPKGYEDGIGLEQRLYISPTYAELGTAAFDVARATFVSAGYYPSKDMIDGHGVRFKPGPFVRAYLNWDLLAEKCYLYADVTGTARRSFTPEVLQVDAGLAVRPLSAAPRVEFRLGAAESWYLLLRDVENGFYGQVRLVF
jgi:hypothetical protein